MQRWSLLLLLLSILFSFYFYREVYLLSLLAATVAYVIRYEIMDTTNKITGGNDAYRIFLNFIKVVSQSCFLIFKDMIFWIVEKMEGILSDFVLH